MVIGSPIDCSRRETIDFAELFEIGATSIFGGARRRRRQEDPQRGPRHRRRGVRTLDHRADALGNAECRSEAEIRRRRADCRGQGPGTAWSFHGSPRVALPERQEPGPCRPAWRGPSPHHTRRKNTKDARTRACGAIWWPPGYPVTMAGCLAVATIGAQHESGIET